MNYKKIGISLILFFQTKSEILVFLFDYLTIVCSFSYLSNSIFKSGFLLSYNSPNKFIINISFFKNKTIDSYFKRILPLAVGFPVLEH